MVSLVLLGSRPMLEAAPKRLVVALDGIAYRDLVALQAGIEHTNFWGTRTERRAFTAAEGYFPVSRMISTFPSVSDVAWTDIFGDRPLPGYQRTYFSVAANSVIVVNGVTSTMEHERQMDFQVENGFLRAEGYLSPAHILKYEIHGMIKNFWNCTSDQRDFYAYIRASDDSQHLDRDILGLLCYLDRQLETLRARYKAREGRDLEIVILSDHGHNHAGRGIRVQDAKFMEQAGYHVGKTINGPRDVVLPVVGIESWVEIHCAPEEEERLALKLCRLKGVDLVMAAIPGVTNSFLVMNTNGARADIDWQPANHAFRYRPVTGDPLHYQPVTDELAQGHQLDAAGFASADAWLNATMTNYYPLALERIVRGLTRQTLNPANVLLSLDNHYVNDNWATDAGSRLVTCRSTHGGLDEICSDGIVLSNFQPTQDTSTERVSEQFENFPGVRDFRALEDGAEFVTRDEALLTRLERVPFDAGARQLSGDKIYLRVWSPRLAGVGTNAALKVTIQQARQFFTASSLELSFQPEVAAPAEPANERVFALPAELKLKPGVEYGIAGRMEGLAGGNLFDFRFRTDAAGRPVAF
jgi:hypothetical protein